MWQAREVHRYLERKASEKDGLKDGCDLRKNSVKGGAVEGIFANLGLILKIGTECD
jgi:hypothetical protein